MKFIKKIKSILLLTFIYTPMIYADVFQDKVGKEFQSGDVFGGVGGYVGKVLTIIIYAVGVVSLLTGIKSMFNGIEKAKQPDGGISDVLISAAIGALVISFGVAVIFIGGSYIKEIESINSGA